MTRALLERCLSKWLEDADPEECTELVEAIRAALAESDTAPAWHDAPTEPGLWLSAGNFYVYTYPIDFEPIGATYMYQNFRWFGPITEDSGGKP